MSAGTPSSLLPLSLPFSSCRAGGRDYECRRLTKIADKRVGDSSRTTTGKTWTLARFASRRPYYRFAGLSAGHAMLLSIQLTSPLSQRKEREGYTCTPLPWRCKNHEMRWIFEILDLQAWLSPSIRRECTDGINSESIPSIVSLSHFLPLCCRGLTRAIIGGLVRSTRSQQAIRIRIPIEESGEFYPDNIRAPGGARFLRARARVMPT